MEDIRILLAEFEESKDENGKSVEERYEEFLKAIRMFQDMFRDESLENLKPNDLWLFLGNRFLRWSWTDLSINKWKFAEKLEEFKKLVRFLKDERVPLERRVNDALKKFKIEGLSIKLITGVLFVLFPEKYGVWSEDNEKALRILSKMPKLSGDIGEDYKKFCEALLNLSNEVDMDLIKLDLFLSYVANREKILKKKQELSELGLIEFSEGVRKVDEDIFAEKSVEKEGEFNVSQILPGGLVVIPIELLKASRIKVGDFVEIRRNVHGEIILKKVRVKIIK